MLLKELESSDLSSFTVNVTDISKVTAKYCRKIISKYRQKLLFSCLVGTHCHVDIFCDFLMFDQIFLSFKFSYLALIMKTRVYLKYFVNDCSLEANISRSY